MMQSMPLKHGSSIKANILWNLSWEKVSAKPIKGHNTLMTSTTILPYKIYISWSISPHWKRGTTIARCAYSLLIVPMIAKTTNNARNSNQYPMCWFNKHWWTTGFRVLITSWAIIHVSPLGTLACRVKRCRV